MFSVKVGESAQNEYQIDGFGARFCEGFGRKIGFLPVLRFFVLPYYEKKLPSFASKKEVLAKLCFFGSILEGWRVLVRFWGEFDA